MTGRSGTAAEALKKFTGHHDQTCAGCESTITDDEALSTIVSIDPTPQPDSPSIACFHSVACVRLWSENVPQDLEHAAEVFRIVAGLAIEHAAGGQALIRPHRTTQLLRLAADTLEGMHLAIDEAQARESMRVFGEDLVEPLLRAIRPAMVRL